eukprot:1666867-Pyramimonas_sp.AAC.2
MQLELAPWAFASHSVVNTGSRVLTAGIGDAPQGRGRGGGVGGWVGRLRDGEGGANGAAHDADPPTCHRHRRGHHAEDP